jgi:ABC-type uncharacterized transport system substrate-binding protein
VEQALSSVSKDTTDGVFVVCSSIFESIFKSMAIKTIQKRLALFGCSAQHVIEHGALVAYDNVISDEIESMERSVQLKG